MNNYALKAILVDDEQGNNDNLFTLLRKYCPSVDIIDTATSVQQAYDLLQHNMVDVVFLDIQMPNENGFELLKKFNPIPFEVIFVTAFDAYGIQAVKFSALDYLLKPIDIHELQLAVHKLSQKIQLNSHSMQLENLKNQLLHPIDKSKHKVALPSTHETFLVKIEDIIYCKSDNSYTTFFIKGNTSYVVCKSIKEFEILLSDYNFIRIHQSYLVNKDYVERIVKKDGLFLQLIENYQVPISKHRKDEVLAQLGI